MAPLSLIADRPPVRPLRQLACGARSDRACAAWSTSSPARTPALEVLDGLCAWLRESGDWDVLRIVRPQFGSADPRSTAGRGEPVGLGVRRLLEPPLDHLSARPARRRRGLAEAPRRPRLAQGHALGAAQVRRVRGGEIVRGGRRRRSCPRRSTPSSACCASGGATTEVYFAHDPEFRGLVHEAVPRWPTTGSAWITVARDDDRHPGRARNARPERLRDGTHRRDDRRRRLPARSRSASISSTTGIGEAVRRGCHNYDFLWVGGYKESFWHAQPRHLESAMVGRGLIGRLAAGCAGPASLRSAMTVRAAERTGATGQHLHVRAMYSG